MAAKSSSLLANAYIKQMLAGPSYPGAAVGLPDGSQMSSFPLFFRQTFILTPVSGSLVFAICPGLGGALAVQTGIVTAPIQRWSASTTFACQTATTVTATFSSTYSILPFNENLVATNLANKAYGPYAATAYRVLGTCAKVSFTGSSLANEGVMGSARLKLPAVQTSVSTVTVNGTPASRFDIQTPPTSFAQLSVLPGFVMQPARKDNFCVNINDNPKYKNTWDTASIIDDSGVSNFNVVMQLAAGGLSAGLNPGIDPNCAVTYYNYTGLDSTATIAVELRSTVEVAIGANSSLAGIAGSNPRKDEPTLTVLADMTRNLPAIQDRPISVTELAHKAITVAKSVNSAANTLGNVYNVLKGRQAFLPRRAIGYM